MPNEIKNDSDVLMTKREIAEYLRLTVSRIGYYRQHGILPEPIYLSSRSPRWRRSDIDEMIGNMTAKFAPIAKQRRKQTKHSIQIRKSATVENDIGVIHEPRI